MSKKKKTPITTSTVMEVEYNGNTIGKVVTTANRKGLYCYSDIKVTTDVALTDDTMTLTTTDEENNLIVKRTRTVDLDELTFQEVTEYPDYKKTDIGNIIDGSLYSSLIRVVDKSYNKYKPLFHQLTVCRDICGRILTSTNSERHGSNGRLYERIISNSYNGKKLIETVDKLVSPCRTESEVKSTREYDSKNRLIKYCVDRDENNHLCDSVRYDDNDNIVERSIRIYKKCGDLCVPYKEVDIKFSYKDIEGSKILTSIKGLVKSYTSIPLTNQVTIGEIVDWKLNIEYSVIRYDHILKDEDLYMAKDHYRANIITFDQSNNTGSTKYDECRAETVYRVNSIRELSDRFNAVCFDDVDSSPNLRHFDYALSEPNFYFIMRDNEYKTYHDGIVSRKIYCPDIKDGSKIENIEKTFDEYGRLKTHIITSNDCKKSRTYSYDSESMVDFSRMTFSSESKLSYLNFTTEIVKEFDEIGRVVKITKTTIDMDDGKNCRRENRKTIKKSEIESAKKSMSEVQYDFLIDKLSINQIKID